LGYATVPGWHCLAAFIASLQEHERVGAGQASVLHRSRSVVRSGTSSRTRSRGMVPGPTSPTGFSGEGLVDVVDAARR